MSYFDEIDRIRRLIRELTESPAMQAIRDLERDKFLLEPRGASLLREVQQRFEATRAATPQILAADLPSILAQYEVVRSISNLTDYRSAAVEVERTLAAYKAVGLPALDALAFHLREATTTVSAAEALQRTFAGELFERLRNVAAAPQEEATARLDALAEFIEQRLAQSRKGPISTEGYIEIILAIVFFLYQLFASQNFEAYVERRLDEIEARLKAVVAVERIESRPDLHVVGARRLRVRDGPAATGPVRALLPVNSVVRILEQQRGWARVEYFDFLSGDSAEGWVASRYLHPLPSTAEE
jgi:hypothetical protein